MHLSEPETRNKPIYKAFSSNTRKLAFRLNSFALQHQIKQMKE